MQPSGLCIRLRRLAGLLSLMCLAGLAGCGPAPTDNAPRLEPRASLGGPSQSPSVSQHAEAPRTDPVIPAAIPAPFASSRLPDGMSVALNDEDEVVQTKPSENPERNWALEQERD